MSLPLAQDVLPRKQSCIHEDHNRLRKAFIISFDLAWKRPGDKLTRATIAAITSEEMAQSARACGVKPPGGPETEDAVRVLLYAALEIRRLAEYAEGEPLPLVFGPRQELDALGPDLIHQLGAQGIPVLLLPVRA